MHDLRCASSWRVTSRRCEDEMSRGCATFWQQRRRKLNIKLTSHYLTSSQCWSNDGDVGPALRGPAILVWLGGAHLDNLHAERVVIGVASFVKCEAFRFLPVDSHAFQVVVSQCQPHLKRRKKSEINQYQPKIIASMYLQFQISLTVYKSSPWIWKGVSATL